MRSNLSEDTDVLVARCCVPMARRSSLRYPAQVAVLLDITYE
jgi:hypothetical protein